MQGSALDPDSVAIAMKSLTEKIIPFLKKQNIPLEDVLVFATAAVRKAMNDPGGSGQNFLDTLIKLGFKSPRVFTEDDECTYAALGVVFEISERYPELKDYAILDTGGASHQLIAIDHNQPKLIAHEQSSNPIKKQISIPLGSHSDLKQSKLPDFKALGFSSCETLILIGTTGTIVSAIPNVNVELIRSLEKQLEPLSVTTRRDLLNQYIRDESIRALFVDFRLKIIDKAFSIISNAALSLGSKHFIRSESQAMHYVSEHGFKSQIN